MHCLGNQIYKYDKERNVGLLEDLLMAMKDTNMIIYLEVSTIPLQSKFIAFLF